MQLLLCHIQEPANVSQDETIQSEPIEATQEGEQPSQEIVGDENTPSQEEIPPVEDENPPAEN